MSNLDPRIKIGARWFLGFWVGLTLMIIFLRNTSLLIAKQSDIDHYVLEGKGFTHMPDRFYEVFTSYYPYSLNNSTTMQCFLAVIPWQHTFIPALRSAENSPFYNCNGECNTTLINLNAYRLAYELEEQITQKEFLNHLLYHFKFAGDRNITEMGWHYFNKQIIEFDDRDIVGVIVLLKDPIGYDPDKYPKKFRERVTEIMEELELEEPEEDILPGRETYKEKYYESDPSRRPPEVKKPFV